MDLDRPGVGRAVPGPEWWAAWLAATVALPLWWYEVTHRWEEDQRVSTALWWTVAALPVLAAGVAARWTRGADRRRTRSALPLAVGMAMLVATAFLGLSLAVYRWVIPLGGVFDPAPVLVSGLSLAAVAAVVGHVIGARRPGPQPRVGRGGFVRAAVVAVAGVIVMPMVLEWGAEDSTRAEGAETLGGPDMLTGVPFTVTLPTAGRYGVYGKGFASDEPDCRIDGPGPHDARAELVTIPPGDYGGDAATYTWVAYFDAAAAGDHSVVCEASEEAGVYVVGTPPRIAGAVGTLIHWPLTVICLLGALPGLLMLALRALRRVPVPARSDSRRHPRRPRRPGGRTAHRRSDRWSRRSYP